MPSEQRGKQRKFTYSLRTSISTFYATKTGDIKDSNSKII